MTAQTITFGTNQYSTFSSRAAGTDYTSNWNVAASISTAEAPLTGSFTNTTGRPIRLANLTLEWWANASPTTANIQFQIATAASGTGGVQSANTNATGTNTIVTMNYEIDRSVTAVYFGFQKQDTGNVKYATHTSTGNQVFEDGVDYLSNRRQTGAIAVQTVPNAPGVANLVSATATTITCSWGAVTDEGSSGGVNGYRICIKEASLPNGTNNANWRVATLSGQASLGDSGSTTRQATITGLTPGTKYDVRVAALNVVTDAWNTDYSTIAAHTGTRTTLTYLSTLSGVYDGTQWSTPTASVYDGNSWQNANVRVYDGNQWDRWGYRP